MPGALSSVLAPMPVEREGEGAHFDWAGVGQSNSNLVPNPNFTNFSMTPAN